MNRLMPLVPGQHQVDDVLGQVVLAAGDPDLLAGDPVAPVALRDRLGAQQAKVGAAVRLGEVHGPRPLAGGQLRQIERLLLGRAAVPDRRIGPVRQAGVHGERHVGGRGHLRDGEVDHARQALAAELRLGSQRRPAGLDELGVGRPEARRGLHREVRIPAAALLVAAAVQRRQHLGAEPAGLLEDLLDRVDLGVGEGRQVGVALDLEHVAQQEGEIAHRRLVGHGGSRGAKGKDAKASKGDYGAAPAGSVPSSWRRSSCS